MSQNRVPTLWLRCGTCGGAPKLAALSAAGAPRITGAVVLPEENVILLPRRPAGRCKAFPRNGSPREFTHLVECICGAPAALTVASFGVSPQVPQRSQSVGTGSWLTGSGGALQLV